MKWKSIVRLRFEIVTVDGARIGGSGGGLEIGGVDTNLSVLKNPATGEPYLPGSSVKGKLRSTLEKEHDLAKNGKPCGCGRRDCPVCPLFGAHMKPGAESAPTRIVVRDAPFAKSYRIEYEKRLKEGLPVLEQKTENIINRKSGTAEHPRTGERLLPGARFNGEIIIHVYDGDDGQQMANRIRHAMAVVQETSGLGAGGSRGSGRVRFENVKEEQIPLADFHL